MQSKTFNGFETYTFTSPDGASSVTCVPARGGALSSIVMPGVEGPRELLFQHDYFWDDTIDDLPGGWPIAFPVFARLERDGERGCYLYDGKRYTLPIHGFAWQEAWQLEALETNRFRIILADNEWTRSVYPFHFNVTLEYEIRDRELICHQTYMNLSDKPMPYCVGFHPYFLTPKFNEGKGEVELNFKPQERFLYNKALTDLVGKGELFSLPSSINNSEINEQLTSVGVDKEVILRYPDGDQIHLCAEGVEESDLFPYVQLYTIPEKPFFCAEPIMAPPNALNTVSGMRWLQPMQSEHGLLKLWLK